MCISRACVGVGEGRPEAESLTRNLVIPATALPTIPSAQLNYLGEAGAIPQAFGCFAMIFSLDFGLTTKSSLLRKGCPSMIFCE